MRGGYKEGTSSHRYAREDGQQGLRPRTPEHGKKPEVASLPEKHPMLGPQGPSPEGFRTREQGRLAPLSSPAFAGCDGLDRAPPCTRKITKPVFKNHPRCTSSGSETNRQQRSPGGTRPLVERSETKGVLTSARRSRAWPGRAWPFSPSEAMGKCASGESVPHRSLQ